MGLLNGILPAIYSFGNQAQRRVRGLLNDPLGALQQQVDQQFPTEYEQENWINQKRGVPYNEYAAASGQQKLDDFARDSAMNAITVWHGSPHKFDKFDMSKIGTGEGAQAYGHGLYMAESPKVAYEYQKNLGNEVNYKGSPFITLPKGNLVGSTGNSLLDDYLHANMGDIKATRKNLLEDTKYVKAGNKEGAKEYQQALVDLRKARNDISVENNGALYKVDIPEEAVSRFLDWDKPLSQQAPEVREAMAPIVRAYGLPMDEPGRSLYSVAKELAANRKGAGSGSPPSVFNAAAPDATEMLLESGIHGIRYLDGGSRGAGTGTSNYVLFDDQMPRILERNGVPTGAQPWQQGEWGGLLK